MRFWVAFFPRVPAYLEDTWHSPHGAGTHLKVVDRMAMMVDLIPGDMREQVRHACGRSGALDLQACG